MSLEIKTEDLIPARCAVAWSELKLALIVEARLKGRYQPTVMNALSLELA